MMKKWKWSDEKEKEYTKNYKILYENILNMLKLHYYLNYYYYVI